MKPKLVVLQGYGKSEPTMLEIFKEELIKIPRYKGYEFNIEEDPYYRHSYRVIPPYDIWLLIKPELIWVYWNQVAFNSLETSDPGQILKFTIYRHDTKNQVHWTRVIKELQEKQNNQELSKIIDDFTAWAESLLSSSPLDDYIRCFTDPNIKKLDEKFINKGGYWMFCKSRSNQE